MIEFKVPYVPQPRQLLLHNSTARHVLYGGAAGGGKSAACRWDNIFFALRNPGFHGAIFRKTLPELRSTHIDEIKREVPTSIAEWNEKLHKFYFTNGSVLTMGYCEHENDLERYLSEEFHAVYVDEGSRFPPNFHAFIRTRNRLGKWRPTNPQDALRLPRFVTATNPGGPSHGFLKRTIVDAAPPETLFYDQTMRDPNDPNDKGWVTIYIPAKMSDNKYLDKGYGASFGALSPELAKAYREGDWDAVVGQAIHNLNRKRHMIRPIKVPQHWTKFMVIDWGTAKPFSVGWWTVSEGVILPKQGTWPERFLAPGALIRYRELYGWNGKENQGCKWSAQRAAHKIIQIERQANEEMDYYVGDTEMWAQRGIGAVAQHFIEAGIPLRRSQKDRIRNYQEVICRLAGQPNPEEQIPEDSDEYDSTVDPMLLITQNCRHFWRTVPSLTYDETDPEKGPDTKQEDHIYDEVAYACRSQPYITTKQDRDDIEYERQLKKSFDAGVDPYAT